MSKDPTPSSSPTRFCGECEACCYIPEIKEGIVNKPACQRCPFQNHGCTIYDKPSRPQVCQNFACGWLRGAGKPSDRPDQSNIMVSINQIESGLWIFAMDLKKNAHRTTGQNIIVAMINKYHLPVIVVDYDNLKEGKGDYVVIHDSMLARSSQLIGKYLGKVNANMKIYQLIIH